MENHTHFPNHTRPPIITYDNIGNDNFYNSGNEITSNGDSNDKNEDDFYQQRDKSNADNNFDESSNSLIEIEDKGNNGVNDNMDVTSNNIINKNAITNPSNDYIEMEDKIHNDYRSVQTNSPDNGKYDGQIKDSEYRTKQEEINKDESTNKEETRNRDEDNRESDESQNDSKIHEGIEATNNTINNTNNFLEKDISYSSNVDNSQIPNIDDKNESQNHQFLIPDIVIDYKNSNGDHNSSDTDLATNIEKYNDDDRNQQSQSAITNVNPDRSTNPTDNANETPIYKPENTTTITAFGGNDGRLVVNDQQSDPTVNHSANECELDRLNENNCDNDNIRKEKTNNKGAVSDGQSVDNKEIDVNKFTVDYISNEDVNKVNIDSHVYEDNVLQDSLNENPENNINQEQENIGIKNTDGIISNENSETVESDDSREYHDNKKSSNHLLDDNTVNETETLFTSNSEAQEVDNISRTSLDEVNSQKRYKLNTQQSDSFESHEGYDSDIDRDRLTAFINEVTERAVNSFSQEIASSRNNEDNEQGNEVTGETSTESKFENKGKSDCNLEESCDKLTEDKSETENNTDQTKNFDVDKETSDNVTFRRENSSESFDCENAFREEGPDSVQNNHNIIHIPLIDSKNPNESEEKEKEDGKEYSDNFSSSSSSSANSLNKMSEDSSCPARSRRPKSSHPRKRGKQDSPIQDDRIRNVHSPSENHLQSKIHKKDTDLSLNDSDINLTRDSQFEENTNNMSPDSVVNNTISFRNQEKQNDTNQTEMSLDMENLVRPEAGGNISWGDENPHSPTDAKHAPTSSSRLSINSDRISRIADAAENMSCMQNNLQEMFREAKTILVNYHSQIQEQTISDFSEDVPEFTRAFSSLSDAYKACENVTGGINEQLQDIRNVTNDICELITNKAHSQGLDNFIQKDTGSYKEKELTWEEKEARRREQEARLQEIKSIAAKATAQAQIAYEHAAQAEMEATQAEVEATKARQDAEIAVRRIEEAKAAAEKRRLEEEEAKRIAEEKAKRRAEEEKRRKEEEERRIAFEAKRKGTSLGDERKLAREEKARLEAERKNPNNWPRHIFSIDDGDWNPGVGLILRAQSDSLDRDDLELSFVDQMESCLPLEENEEIISNIMCLMPADHNKQFKFEEPMSVAIPHCCPRIVPGREPVVKLMTSEGKMSVLKTQDLMFDDIKELKFAEVRLREFGTMAVFLRPKKETLSLNKMGGKVISSVDSRVTITSCENAFKTHATFTMEVQPIDQNLVMELKTKRPEDCGNLMSTSPFVTVNMTCQFHKPLTLTLPCPANPALRTKRPQTAGNRLPPPVTTTDKKQLAPLDRPLSALPFLAKEEPEILDEVHLLRKDGTGSWMKMDDIALIHARKKDVITLDMTQPFNKLVIIRTKAGLSNSQVERILGHLIVALTFKPVSVIMRQRSSDPNSVTVTCTQSSNIDKVLKSLHEEGYDHGPKPTPEIHLTEGQRLALRFRGNLIVMDEFKRSTFMFCNHIPFRLSFSVTEVDKYAQKGFHSYRGFSQIFTKGKVRKASMAVDDRDRTGQKQRNEFVDGDILICEHLIIIPKPDPETPRPLNVAPVSLTNEGVVNDGMLRFLSTHIQDNDWKRLATLLNIKRSRLQAILRQNLNNSPPQMVYDILLSWSKRLPRAVNRTDILCCALSSIGREDLVEELRVKDEKFRQERQLKARESYLRKAFVAIVRNPMVVGQWKHLARHLDVDDDVIKYIESTHQSFQEKCLASLKRWKEMRGEEATIPLLATKLRRCRYRKLARQIEEIR